VFHNIDFTNRGPPAIVFIFQQQPEGRNKFIRVQQLYTRFYSAITPIHGMSEPVTEAIRFSVDNSAPITAFENGQAGESEAISALRQETALLGN
jgi:hypothetical protein